MNSSIQPEYILIGDTAGGILMRKCGKTINTVRGTTEDILSIQQLPSAFASAIALIGLKPIDVRSYVGARAYSIVQNAKGNLGFRSLQKGEKVEGALLHYFMHSETRQIVGIYF